MPLTARQRSIHNKNGTKRTASFKDKRSRKASEGEILVTDAPSDLRSIVYPGGAVALALLLVARLASAFWGHISDCDETYNYWEPLHYLVYGSGLQTWEYSPVYAIRSYLPLWLFAVPAKVLSLCLAPSTVFYCLKALLAILTACAELVFYKGVCHEFGVHVGRVWLALTLPAAGSFAAAAAMLPSSWSMGLVAAALASWWRHRYPSAIVFTAATTLLSWPFTALIGLPIAIDMLYLKRQFLQFFKWSFLTLILIPAPTVAVDSLHHGWPFTALIGLPIAIDMLYLKRQFLQFLKWSFISLILILAPTMAVDSLYYGQLVIAPWNIVAYNIFTSHGPDLYGVEPWTYYFVNGFLNFNIVWAMALSCPLFLLACAWSVRGSGASRAPFCRPYAVSLMPLGLWLAVFGLQPHKEERFLYPVYTMIVLAGAIALDCVQKLAFALFGECYRPKWWKESRRRHYLAYTNQIVFLVGLIAGLAGISRTVALYNNYHGPMTILSHLPAPQSPPLTVCYGKDWYRSPSSFLLPPGGQMRFIRSEFKGQLPAPYSDQPNATRLIHPYFNDQNKIDNSTLVDVSKCHYLVDSDIGQPTMLQPAYHKDESWEIVASVPIVDAERSHPVFRAFYVPVMSSKYCTFANLYLLKNKLLST